MNYLKHALLFYNQEELAQIGRLIFAARLGNSIACEISFCEDTELDVFEVRDGEHTRHYLIEEHLEDIGKVVGCPIRSCELEYFQDGVPGVCAPNEMLFVLTPDTTEV